MSTDGGLCHIYERYADSAAVMIHLTTFGERYAARFEQALEPLRTVVDGSPTGHVKEALADPNPVYMEPAAGLADHGRGAHCWRPATPGRRPPDGAPRRALLRRSGQPGLPTAPPAARLP
jgi:hypothetical protein